MAHEDIRIGTIVRGGPEIGSYLEQVIPHGFESFEITFGDKLGDVEVQTDVAVEGSPSAGMLDAPGSESGSICGIAVPLVPGGNYAVAGTSDYNSATGPAYQGDALEPCL